MRTLARYFTLAALVLPIVASAQMSGAIKLRNPSFEDMPRNSMAPIGWIDCGFPMETPPDVQPDPMNQFQVSMHPQHGNTYLGMVVRDNDTYERVGQELDEPMVGGQCYSFRIQLARSKVYLSASRVTSQAANYVTPALLRIHGGYDLCDRTQIIGKTELVTNYDWQEYRIKLRPEQDFTHIVFEVFYKTPALFTYNGNVLLDNASPLVPIDCDAEIPDDPIEPFTEPIAAGPTPQPVPGTDTRPRGGDVTPSPPAEPKIKLGETEAELKVNTIFKIEDITFKANIAELETSSESALQEIVLFMRSNPGVVVEIGGHANTEAGTTFANEISLDRAKSVVEYLRTHGVARNRLFPRGYGKQRPVCVERTDDCQRRNQRVEVKIVRLEE